MFNKKQVKDLKEHLNKAQNPLFFFDNDQDGLCSFLILQRAYDKGKGFPIKSPELNKDYFRKVRELNPDYIFILDMPRVSEDFFEKISQYNIPVVWIDHHLLAEEEKEKIPDFVEYYNPQYNKVKSGEPVTALCYQLTSREEDLWLAVVGCVSDGYLPPKWFKKFVEKYPDLAGSFGGDPDKMGDYNAFDVFYNSEIGRIARMFAYGLKDRTTNVVRMMKFLKTARSPYDVLYEGQRNKEMHKRYEEINKKYEKFLKDAKSSVEEKDKIVFYEYQGEMSMSSEIANGLSYLFPDKYVMIVYTGGDRANVSGRGENVKKIVLEALEGIEDSTGGGHNNAVGARIKKDDVPKFKENLEKIVKKKEQ